MTALFSARDYRRPEDQVSRTVLWCKGCDYGRIDGNFTPDEVGNFYQMPYYTHDGKGPHSAEKKSFLNRVLVHLAWRRDKGTNLSPDEVNLTVKGRPATLCDVGCGAGGQLYSFHSAGYEVSGIEPDERARSFAASHKLGPVFEGTAERIPTEMKGRKFDVVLLFHALEHCIDPFVALRNAKELLAPGGSVVVEVPNNAALGFSWFGATWPWTDVPRHLHLFSEKSLRKLFETAGFKVTQVRYVGFTRQFQADWIASHYDIWNQLEKRSPPNLDLEAWLLWLRTAFAKNAKKYISVRVHAEIPASGT